MSDAIKSQVIDNILLRATAHFDREQVNIIQTLLWVGLKDYDVIAVSKELTTCDMSNLTLIKRFLANKMLEGCTPRTIEMYGMTLRQYIQKCPKSFLITETRDIKTYLALMMSSGCSKTYCNIHRRVLSSFFVWLFNEGLVPKNPMRGIKKIKQPKILEEAFSYADMEKIRAHCIDVRERAIVEVLLSTGCRAGELVGATLSNLHLSEGTLKVYGKGQKERIVYLNAAAKLWLGKYLKGRNDEEDCLFAAKQRQNGKAVALRTAGLEILIRKLGRRAGVNKCHPHRFRRTAATWAARRGMRLEQVQQMLGHEQIETTMIYVSVAQKDVQIAHERYMGGD